MNIHDKINNNAAESVFIVVFKNRRWEQFGGWKYDNIQWHTVRKDRLESVLKMLNKQGYFLD